MNNLIIFDASTLQVPVKNLTHFASDYERSQLCILCHNYLSNLNFLYDVAYSKYQWHIVYASSIYYMLVA